MDHALCLSDSKQGSCAKHVSRGGPGKINKGSKGPDRVAFTYSVVVVVSLSFLNFDNFVISYFALSYKHYLH